MNLAKALVGSSDWYQKQWEQLDQLSHTKWLIIWGTEDEFITMDYFQKWIKRFPNAERRAFLCGHFVQEEKTAESIEAIINFMK